MANRLSGITDWFTKRFNMAVDPRDEYIARVAKDKSFAEIGGLWGTVNEKVSVAHKNGANALTMIDVVPPQNELWRLFDERRKSLNLPDVQCISSDVLRLAEIAPAPQFDVVHCSGVLYHVPDPIRFLVALKKLTRRHLILNSLVTGTNIKSDMGSLKVPDGAALFVPALSDQERAIIKSYWQPFVGDAAIGVTTGNETWSIDDFGPWWWLPTVEALRAMCRVAGFYDEDGAYFWNNNAYVLLLRVTES